MKTLTVCAIAAMLICAMGVSAMAYDTEFEDVHEFDRSLPWWKLGRGFSNVLAGPHELWTSMTNEAIKGARKGSYKGGLHGYMSGSLNGYIAGFFPGLYKGVRRMTTGVLEMATFWKPEYGPTIDPEYGTRLKSWGSQDYFEEPSYWYGGPQFH